MDNKLLIYREATQNIKHAILQSRYRAAENANIEMLNLYYGVGEYISVTCCAQANEVLNMKDNPNNTDEQ